MSQDPWKVQEYEDNNWINLPERLVTTLLGHEENKTKSIDNSLTP